MNLGDFDQRYLLARYPTGGVVVDLQSGNYFRVNSTAALVCEALRAGDRAELRVASDLGVPREKALRMVSEVVVELARPAVGGTIQGSYHFYPASGGYVLRHGERTVLEVDGASLDIRLPTGGGPPSEQLLELYVRGLAPKLLFQHGVTVLHASACMMAGKPIAFAGLSGAGKTTTARAFATAGARLLSEDLVVLSPGAQEPRVLLEAESLVQTWARECASALLREPRRGISSRGLSAAAEGPSEAIETILFLDSSRRFGDQFTVRALAEPDPLIGLMTHNFLGALEPDTWRRFFASAIALIEKVRPEEACAPDGVDLLPGAVARYIAKRAS